MNENFFSKDDPAINGRHHHITKRQYNEEAHNIHNIDKKNQLLTLILFLIEQYFNKQNVNNIMINNITKKLSITQGTH